ncbi:ABC transporter ATP-binding protein [Insolitispirillum peregrinum]|uniref:Putative spermidine/putrescine transport system ATP-binding protein n=1 Tax=Insolitispirillum peregrinum TaxID=80876 RepID=A0A1N7IHI4_9PROT|nr:ABC transporter ATP-binding protein [Insolitispirillum peregrinum]SIS36476.1 putative spermidine/putrescine transport system ATP-binding protein [Insolitispirillum peregrinum]
MSVVTVSNFAKRYGSSTIFTDISFTLRSGEFVTLLGPSGCGKSTLLRCISGLTGVDQGTISVDGSDITHTAPQKRGIGMVFQSYALFPNMTAAQNIAFGLKMQKLTAAEIADKVAAVVKLVELDGREQQYPHQLSGGQRQRVALARALVVEPRILLLDEPLSALDARIRKTLREQIRDIQRRLGLTTIFVTHDQEEALTLSDRIFVMNQGRVEQEGSAETVYTQPATEFVARFMGSYNLLTAAQSQSLLGITPRGHLTLRPEAMELLTSPETDTLPAVIKSHQLLGNVIRYQVDCQGVALSVDCLNRSAEALLADGAAVFLRIARDTLREVQ